MKHVYKFLMTLLIFLGVAASSYIQAQVYAGDDAAICASQASYTINDASDGGYATITWTTSGDGGFDDPSIEHPTYTPGPNDWSNGSVTLTLTAVNTLPPPAPATLSDEMELTLYAPFTTGSIEGSSAMVLYPLTTVGDYSYSTISANLENALMDFSNLTNYNIADDDYGNVLQSYPKCGATDYPLAATLGSYFELTLDAWDYVELDSLVFEVGKGGSANPRGYFIRSSVDNYATDLISETLPESGQPAPERKSIALGAAFENISTVTFRFYIFTPDCEMYSVDWRNIAVIYGDEAGEEICLGGDPAEIGNVEAASGGDGTYTYRWQSSTDEAFSSPTDIPGTNALTYDPPAGLMVETWYRRMAHDGTCSTSFEPSDGIWHVTLYQPELNDLTLSYSTDEVSWNDVGGNMSDGFEMCIDPDVEYYYLDVNTFASDPALASSVYNAFYLNTSNLPTDFYTYWDNKGVNAGAEAGTWMAAMYQIIIAEEPMFFLYYDGSDYVLYDGLQKNFAGTDATLRINGDYPGGDYTFDGSIEDVNGCTGDVSIDMNFQTAPTAIAGADASICSDASYYIQDNSASNYASVTWTGGSGSFASSTSLHPTYFPDPSEAGSTVTLTFTAEPKSPCDVAASDDLELTIYAEPTISDITLDYSTDMNAWNTVGGNLENGFELCLDPVNTFYYLDVNTLTSDPALASSVYNAFYLSTQMLPAGFYSYWDAKGVNASAAVGTWQEQMYQIIEGYEPMFYLYYDGSGYTLYDGLQRDFYESLEALRVSGDYPTGTYSFFGNVEDENGCIKEYSFSMSFQQAPVADAGEDDTVCSDTYNLNALGSENYNSFSWSIESGDGNGYFDNTPGTLTSSSPAPTFTGTRGETYTLELTVEPISPCTVADEDTVEIFFQEDATAFAGNDATTCEDTPYEIQDASASNYSSIMWSGGNGSFDDPQSENPVYTPAHADAVAGSVTLTLVAQPINPCETPAESSMTLTVGTAPTVNAGEDKNICNIGAFVNGSATNTDGTLWVSYTGGTFDDASDLSTYYHTSLQDRINGTVELTLVAAAQTPCVLPKYDDIILTITQDSPVVFAGDDDTSCEDASYTLEHATATNYDALVWVTEGDGTFDDENLLHATYTFGADDLSAGYAILKLVADPISPCTILIEDQMRLSVQENPEADAGVNATVCENQTYHITTATAANYSSLNWYSVLGTGTFEDEDELHPVYYPSMEDIAAGSVELCLAAEAISPCEVAAIDCMTLTFQYLPIANAGADAEICEYEDYTLSDASAQYYSDVTWTTSGDGEFLLFRGPQPKTPPGFPVNPTYVPGSGDIASGSVELCITAAPISPCTLSDTDCMTLTIHEEPAVIFAANGNQFYSAETLEYCYDDVITVTLDEIVKGEAPFEIAWEVNGTPNSASGVEVGDELFSSTLAPDTYEVAITSITDANGCSVQNVAPYTVTVIVHPEPAVLFAFNGTQAYEGSDFTFCEDETVTVTLDQIVSGTEPFDIEWTVNGDADSKTEVYLDDELFSSMLDPGTYTVQITNITDGNGCSISDPSIYNASVFIQALPIAFAGADAEICAYESYELSDATAENYSAISWTTTLGDGNFDDPTSENPTYTPGTSDKLAGSVELCMLLAPIDPCTTGDNDCMTLTINPEPAVLFAFNDEQASTGSVFEYCYDETVTVTLDEIVQGEAPFDISWTVNGDAGSATGINLGDALFSDQLDAGTYDIQITDITDNNGCSVQDPSIYNAQVIVHPEPFIVFAFNDVQAAPGFEAEYCYNEPVTVTLDEIWSGEAPFEVCYSVTKDGDAFMSGCETVSNPGDEFFSQTLEAGVYEISVTSVTDSYGCVASQATLDLYTATITINPEPFIVFAFNGQQVAPGFTEEYCYDQPVVVTLDEIWSGEAPFEVCYAITKDGDAYESDCVTVENIGDELFNEVLDPGVYEVSVTSLTDGDGCVASPATLELYTATITINPEPFIVFAFNGEQADPGFEKEYCYDETVEVTLDEIWSGDAPFEVCYSVTRDGDPFMTDCATVTNPGDQLFSQVLDPGVYEVSVTSLTDDNGCVASQATLDLYTATITVHPEPFIVFAFNGEQAAPGFEKEYCYSDNVVVTLDEIWSGDAPFEVCYEVTKDGDPFDSGCESVTNPGDELFNQVLDAGVYEVSVTSLTDGNGCVATQATLDLYTATVTVHPEPAVLFAFNGVQAYEGSEFLYCENQDVTVTLDEVVSGTAPFDIAWTVNGEADNATGVNVGDQLFSSTLEPGSYTVQITSITDANGCVISDPSIYNATVDIQALPSVNILPEEATICYGEMFDFEGLVEASDYNAIIWYTTNGNGSFSNDYVLEPIYQPNPTTDYPQGCIEIGVTVAPIDPCTVQDEDFMTLCFQAPPLAIAGDDATVCEGSDYALDGATAEEYTSLLWSGGDGTFNDETALNPVYTPGATDIENGFAELCLTAAPISPCEISSTDCMILTINPAPAVLFAFNGEEVYEGSEFDFCYNTTVTATLDQVLVGTAPFYIAWEVNGDPADATGVNPGDELFSSTLDPGTYEVQITSIVDANGCSPLDLSVYHATVNIIPAPVAFAGEDANICETDSYELLDAAPENYSAVSWTTSGDGSFDDPNTANPTYTPGDDDIANGEVTLCQYVDPIDPCTMTDEDCMTLYIQMAPVAFAGDDATICQDISYQVFGGAVNACGFSWSTSGDGEFENPEALATNYTPGDNDKLEGQVDLCLTAEPCDPCSVADTDCMTLFISQNPTVAITAPEDGAMVYVDPVTVEGTADDSDGNLDFVEVRVNGGTWATATGAANWTIDVALQPCFNTIEARAVDTYGCMSDIEMITVELRAQDIPLLPSWSYISSYVDPIDNDITNIIDNDVTPGGNTVIILNARGKFYWPGNGNTLGTWNSYDGYKIKVNTEGTLRMRGEPVDDPTLEMENGFHIMPVLTNQLTPITDVFADPMNDILIIYEIQTNRIYWPGGGLFTLTDLTPGFGYLVNLINPATATFPPAGPCADKAGFSYQLVQNNGPWPITRTSDVHLISIDRAAIAELEDVSFIGAFDALGTCIGYAQVTDDSQNVLLTVYGDEATTAVKDGATVGENISFMAYSDKTGEEQLTAVYDLSMPNYDGKYASNGISKINSFKETTTGIGTVANAENVQVFPNPANDNVTISVPFDGLYLNPVRVTFINAAGGTVKQIKLSEKQTQVDVSNLQPGVYVMKFENKGTVVVKRLVIR